MSLDESCNLCGSRHLLTFHHLIPKTCHKNKWFQKRFTREDMQNRGITVCRQCHSFIHKQFSEKDLGRYYNSLELLLSDEKIIKFVSWAKKRVER